MNNDKRTDYIDRDRILNLLSPAELASVSTAEDGAKLASGDEYIDLGHLEQGVRTVPSAAAETRMLPRKAVTAATWKAIIAMLPAH